MNRKQRRARERALRANGHDAVPDVLPLQATVASRVLPRLEAPVLMPLQQSQQRLVAMKVQHSDLVRSAERLRVAIDEEERTLSQACIDAIAPLGIERVDGDTIIVDYESGQTYIRRGGQLLVELPLATGDA